MKLKRTLSGILAAVTFAMGTASTVGSANAVSVETKDTPNASAAAVQSKSSGEASNAAKYGLCENVENGVILHAFSWSFNTIKDNMKDIAEAGYTAVQTSPANKCYEGYTTKTLLAKDRAGYDGHDGAWWWQYQPIALSVGNYQLGTRAEYEAMCKAADEYGVKIITDIVANHTTAETGEDDKYLVSDEYSEAVGGYGNLYHDTGDIARPSNPGRFQYINYKNGGLPDINTENPLYQRYLLTYLNDLIDLGCDGFRFDMARNIGITGDPTNDSETGKTYNLTYNFWDVATGKTGLTIDSETYHLRDVPNNFFFYGEILGNELSDQLFERYSNYIKITASSYGDNLRSCVKAKNFSSEKLSGWNHHLEGSKLVTWVESHDSYCNVEPVFHESGWMTDWQIKMAWAVITAREGGTPLFFSRPDGSDGSKGNYWGNNVMGEKGNDQFKDPEIAAVNKFRNAMAGQGETLRNIDSDNRLLQIDRGTKGSCIINLSSSDRDIESETTMAAGTYIDSISGNIFTVETINGKNYIKGRVPAEKFAVVYTATDVDLTASYSGDAIFESTLDVALSNNSSEKVSYSVSVNDEVVTESDFTNSTSITIGDVSQKTLYTKNITIALSTYDSQNDRTVNRFFNFLKQEKSDDNYIYFDNSSYNWSKVYAYIYIDDNTKIAAWPGVQLTEKESGTGYYKYKLPYKFRNAQVIFTASGDDSNTQRYPASDVGGLYVQNRSMLLGKNYSWEEYPVTDDVKDGKQNISSYSYVYFFNNSNWTENQIQANLWNDSIGMDNGVKQYMAYSDSLHCYYLKYDNSYKFDKVKFLNGSDTEENSGELTLYPGKMYVQNYNSLGEWTSFENIEARKLYFKNENSWSKVKIYLWNSSKTESKNAAWPGESMTLVDSGTKMYSYTYYSLKDTPKYNKVIISNDSASNPRQTENLDIPDFSTGDAYVITPGTTFDSKNKCAGTLSKAAPAQNKTISVTLNYCDHKVGKTSTPTSNAVENSLSSKIDVSVTDANLDNIAAAAVGKFQINNLYESYVFHTSEFEYVKTIASATDNERIGNNLNYAAKINPQYFGYETSLYSGKYTEIGDLTAEKENGIKWVTYKNNGTEVLPEKVKPDLSNVTDIELWGYSVPNSYYVELHYPTSSSQNLKVKLNDNLYTAQYTTGLPPEKCYYNQLLNQNGENLTSNMATPDGYTFDGWYMINFKDNSYVKVSSEKDFACRVTSDINLYAVFRDKESTPEIGASSTANNVDVYSENNVTKYRFNTMLNIYNYDNANITDVAVIYVKLDSGETDYNVSDIRNELAVFGSGSITVNGKTAPYFSRTYSTSGNDAVTLTNKNRLQFILTLTEDQKKDSYSNVLAFTAFKSGEKWTISDNCAAYKDGVPKTVYISD